MALLRLVIGGSRLTRRRKKKKNETKQVKYYLIKLGLVETRQLFCQRAASGDLP